LNITDILHEHQIAPSLNKPGLFYRTNKDMTVFAGLKIEACKNGQTKLEVEI